MYHSMPLIWKNLIFFCAFWINGPDPRRNKLNWIIPAAICTTGEKNEIIESLRDRKRFKQKEPRRHWIEAQEFFANRTTWIPLMAPGIVSLSFCSVRSGLGSVFSVPFLIFHFSIQLSVGGRSSAHIAWTWRLGPFSFLTFFFCLLCA